MPQYITLHLLHFCNSCQQSVTFHEIDVALSRVLYLSSAINPFVYAWRVPKYRQALIDCWKICRGVPHRGITGQSSLSHSSQMNTSRIVQKPILTNKRTAQTCDSESTCLWIVIVVKDEIKPSNETHSCGSEESFFFYLVGGNIVRDRNHFLNLVQTKFTTSFSCSSYPGSHLLKGIMSCKVITFNIIWI